MSANFALLDIKKMAMSNRRIGACRMAAHVQASTIEASTAPVASRPIDRSRTVAFKGLAQRFVQLLAVFAMQGGV